MDKIFIQPSRYLLWANSLFHISVVFLILLSTLVWWAKLLTVISVLLHGFVFHRRYVRMSCRSSVIGLAWLEGRLAYECNNANALPISRVDIGAINQYLIIVTLCSHRGSVKTILCADAVSPNEHHRIRQVILKI